MSNIYTPENDEKALDSDVFRGYRNSTLKSNELIMFNSWIRKRKYFVENSIFMAQLTF